MKTPRLECDPEQFCPPSVMRQRTVEHRKKQSVQVKQRRGQGVNWDRADEVMKGRAERIQRLRLLRRLKRAVSAFTEGFLRTGGSQQRE